MITITTPATRTTVYDFNELSETAQAAAIAGLWDINLNMDFVIEDAAEVGLNITSHELDSASFVRNINGKFDLHPDEVMHNILLNHGENSSAYKTAIAYKDAVQSETAAVVENAADEFLGALINDYKNIMQSELEFQCSREEIIRTIEANEYTFTENGELKIINQTIATGI